MSAPADNRDWKLRLRYGKLTTPYRHFTVISEGALVSSEPEYECPTGDAFMGMNCWASSNEEAQDMAEVIGPQIGFEVTGLIRIWADTDPREPPQEKPYAYDIRFTPIDGSKSPGANDPEPL